MTPDHKSVLAQYVITMKELGEPPFPVTRERVQAFIVFNVVVKMLKAHAEVNYISRLKSAVEAAELGWVLTPAEYTAVGAMMDTLAVCVPAELVKSDAVPSDALYRLYLHWKPWEGGEGLQNWAFLLVAVHTGARGDELTGGHFELCDVSDIPIDRGYHLGGFVYERQLRKACKGVLGLDTPAYIFNLGERFRVFSPGYWLQRHLDTFDLQRYRGTSGDHRPVFAQLQRCTDGRWRATARPLSRAAAEAALKEGLRLSSPELKGHFTMHSPRPTARTMYATLGVPETVYNLQCGWALPQGSSAGYDRSFSNFHLIISKQLELRGVEMGLAREEVALVPPRPGGWSNFLQRGAETGPARGATVAASGGGGSAEVPPRPSGWAALFRRRQ
jgi:hypothetical protein